MKVLLDSNGYSLLMRRNAEGCGEQQGRFGYSLRRWAALRGSAAAGMMGGAGFLRVVIQRTPIYPFPSK